MTKDEWSRLGVLLMAMWRIGMLLALLFAGWQLLEIKRGIFYHAGISRDAEESLRAIASDVDEARITLESVERNTRR